jgi:hypothetical protein
MDALDTTYRHFTDLLSNAELERLADQYGVADQRERTLPLRIVFWLLVVSAGQPTVRGALFQLVAFFVGALSGLVPMAPALTLTKMALSVKWQQISWFFFNFTKMIEAYRPRCAPLYPSAPFLRRRRKAQRE